MSESSPKRKRLGTEGHDRDVEHLSKFAPTIFEKTREVKSLTNSVLSSEALSECDEVWILECPKNLNISEHLDSCKVDLSKVKNLGDDSKVLLTNSIGEWVGMGVPKLKNGNPTENLITLLPDEEGNMKLVPVPVTAYLRIREQVEDQPSIVLPSKPRAPHKIPEGIKERHAFRSIGVGVATTSNGNKNDTNVSGVSLKRKRKSEKSQKKNSR